MDPVSQGYGLVSPKDDPVVEDEAPLERCEDLPVDVRDVRGRPVPSASRRDGVERRPVWPCVGYGRVRGVVGEQREVRLGAVAKVNVHGECGCG